MIEALMFCVTLIVGLAAWMLGSLVADEVKHWRKNREDKGRL